MTACSGCGGRVRLIGFITEPETVRLYWRMLARQQLHRPRATKPLWRRAQGPGSGLGLSILQAICARYGAELKLQLRNIGGLTVCLALALAPMSNNHQLSL